MCLFPPRRRRPPQPSTSQIRTAKTRIYSSVNDDITNVSSLREKFVPKGPPPISKEEAEKMVNEAVAKAQAASSAAAKEAQAQQTLKELLEDKKAREGKEKDRREKELESKIEKLSRRIEGRKDGDREEGLEERISKLERHGGRREDRYLTESEAKGLVGKELLELMSGVSGVGYANGCVHGQQALAAPPVASSGQGELWRDERVKKLEWEIEIERAKNSIRGVARPPPPIVAPWYPPGW